MEKLEAIWESLNGVSSGVGSNAGSIAGLGADLADQAIVAVTLKTSGLNNGISTYTFVNKKKVQVGTVQIDSANSIHIHRLINGAVNDGVLSFNISTANTSLKDSTVDLSHSHKGTAKFNEDGTVTIEITKSFSDTKESITTSNSVTDTSWYKNKIAAAKKAGQIEGWELAASMFTKVGNTVSGPEKGIYGASDTYTAKVKHNSGASWSYEGKLTYNGTVYYTGIKASPTCSPEVDWE